MTINDKGYDLEKVNCPRCNANDTNLMVDGWGGKSCRKPEFDFFGFKCLKCDKYFNGSCKVTVHTRMVPAEYRVLVGQEDLG